jgi:HAE1 family hydrophobic/amphiphilic exporter-1
MQTLAPDPSYTFEMAGEAKRMQETFTNLGIALLLSILFIYFVLAAQFESFLHPLTIMLSLPLAIVGALVGLFLSGFAVGMPALIGIILLMGLVTKNAILLVDFANQRRDQGKSILDALLEAGETRLRPILMTSAAMILGMLPTAVGQGEGSEFRAPMSVAVIGGVVTSTLLTLVVVPVFYVWIDRLTLRGRRERRAGKT